MSTIVLTITITQKTLTKLKPKGFAITTRKNAREKTLKTKITLP